MKTKEDPVAPAHRYTVRFEPDEDGWLHVSVPELPGCHTQARSVEEGCERIREAIALVLDLQGDRYEGELVPEPATLPRRRP